MNGWMDGWNGGTEGDEGKLGALLVGHGGQDVMVYSAFNVGVSDKVQSALLTTEGEIYDSDG